jgi:hypothetical protein
VFDEPGHEMIQALGVDLEGNSEQRIGKKKSYDSYNGP